MTDQDVKDLFEKIGSIEKRVVELGNDMYHISLALANAGITVPTTVQEKKEQYGAGSKERH